MSTIESIDWREKINQPETADQLNRLVDRADEFESLLDLLGSAKTNVKNLVATAADVADEKCQSAAEEGIDFDARFQHVLQLVEKVTRPETLQALSQLVDRLPQLAKLSRFLDELPGLVATLADVADDFARKSAEQGIDLELSISNGLRSMLWLGQQINQQELERLGVLLKSDMLAPQSIEVVANAANSLAHSQSESCEPCRKKNSRVGMFGLLSALRDENIQRALGFAVSFGKCFGANLKKQTKET